MNRVAWWRLALMALALGFGLLYTLPNFFGEQPAVQVSTAKATLKVEAAVIPLVERSLSEAGLVHQGISFDAAPTGNTVRARFSDTDDQLRAREVIEATLNKDRSDYVVALNLVSATPSWLTQINALPMYLGLDLRGGVHFMLQVDMAAALSKRLDALQGDARTLLREKRVRHSGISRGRDSIEVRFAAEDQRAAARLALTEQLPELEWQEVSLGDTLGLIGRFKPATATRIQEFALKQNITTLSNRINELGVAEPIVQQQGADRIVVQLPGVQDTAKAKDILGRTATLEIRMVEDGIEAAQALTEGRVPAGFDLYTERGGAPLLLRKDVILTGSNLTDAQAGFDSQNPLEPAVHLTLDAKGARIFREITRENIGKRMAILLIEKGQGEVITAPVIRSEIPGGRVQISGRMTTVEAADTALLLRAGSLAAPMEIIEERLIGPSLGADNIAQGFSATTWGFVAIAVFMAVYYSLFGVISVLALCLNLLLLFSLLSILQATLTLPGIAAVALTLGMAIDANVLINERVREEIRAGAVPQVAIATGYDKAWATILDSNITTLIAGVALLAFGSGPVRGFAVVHVLGILTSMFSAVFFSRGLVNLWYGSRKRLGRLAIG
ncbi:MAG: protein translocase subunit SecD [Betaproteobacteria bacterium]|nr:protein translocase subunit SecD [Betaproteobacteria bacterium]